MKLLRQLALALAFVGPTQAQVANPMLTSQALVNGTIKTNGLKQVTGAQVNAAFNSLYPIFSSICTGFDSQGKCQLNVNLSGVVLPIGQISGSYGSGDLAGSPASSPLVAQQSITNAKLAPMGAGTFKGATLAGQPVDLSGIQATAGLVPCVGDSGSGGTKGLVPPAGAGDSVAGKFLGAGCTWSIPPLPNCVPFWGSPSLADNAPVLNAQLAAMPIRGGCIAFPYGRFVFASQVNANFPNISHYSVSIVGAGAEVTQLVWTTLGGNGFVYSMQQDRQSFHFRDLSLITTNANSGSAITASNTSTGRAFDKSDLTNVTIRGDDGPIANLYWTYGVNLSGVSNVSSHGLYYAGYGGGGGTGFIATGSSSILAVLYNFDDCYFYSAAVGINAGTYTQGYTVNYTNFNSGGTAIFVPPGAKVVDEITATNSQFNTFNNQIVLQGDVLHADFSHNLVFVTGGNAGFLYQSTYVGGQYQANMNIINCLTSGQGTGITQTTQSGAAIALGNIISTCANGFNLGNLGAWTVALNRYPGTTTHVVNGTNNTVGQITD